MWFYSDKDLTNSFWGPNQPDKRPGNKNDCGVMVAHLDSFWWEDTNCLVPNFQDKVVATICQYDTAADSTTTTTEASAATTTAVEVCAGWEIFEGHCYLNTGNVNTWYNATEDCNNRGGFLATVHSEAENKFISSLASAYFMWIGASDIQEEARILFFSHSFTT